MVVKAIFSRCSIDPHFVATDAKSRNLQPPQYLNPMKTLKTTNLLFPVAVVTLFLALPGAARAGDFAYTVENGAIAIAGYTGSGGAVIIPDKILNYPVVNIKDGAFAGKGAITSVSIPNSVTNIGVYAFNTCDGLTNATLGTGIVSIGFGAFYECTSLANLTLPNGVLSIGESAFAQCSSLSTIKVPDSVAFLGDYAFNNCAGLTNAALGNHLARISANAFSWCGNLVTLSIANGIQNIGSSAFAECLSLTSVVIPDSVTNIEFYAFSDCLSLTNVAVGSGVTVLGENAFEYCTSLTAIYFNGDAPDDGGNIFLNDPLTVYYLSETAGWGTTFGDRPTALWYPFTYTVTNGKATITGYQGFASAIVIPSKIGNNYPVISIGDSAFRNHTNLTGVLIPGSVTNIGANAFAICSRLAAIVIPSSVIGIGSGAFTHCANLTSITADFNLVYASVDGVLFNQDRTTLIQYPGGKTGSYNIPNGVFTVESGAFDYTIGLTSVIMPDSLDTIWNGAFAFCPNLTRVTIGRGIYRVADYAFANSTNLLAVYFRGAAPIFGDSVFTNDLHATVYYLPAESSGWTAVYSGRPIAPWDPQVQTGTGLGVRANGFGFKITASSTLDVVVEACTDLARPVWQPVQMMTLTGGVADFHDSQWTNYAARYYRIRTP